MDRVQAKLAWHSGLIQEVYTRRGSGIWRDNLVGFTYAQRLDSAKKLLKDASQDDSNMVEKEALCAFMSSKDAMRLAIEGYSHFRICGDDIAHHDLSKPQFTAIVDEHRKLGGPRAEGLEAFVSFLFP